MQALAIIASVFVVYMHRRREKIKREAANVLAGFVVDAYESSKFQRIIQAYRLSGMWRICLLDSVECTEVMERVFGSEGSEDRGD